MGAVIKRTGKIMTIKIMLIALLLILFINIESEAQVIVQIQQPPPYQFKLENMWKVTLINSTGGPLRVYLRGTASEASNGLIADVTTALFNLEPGIKVISPALIMPLKIASSNSKYDRVVKSIGTVPGGDYEICVAVINAADGIELGQQCISQTVINISQTELIAPDNGKYIEDTRSAASFNNTIENVEFINGSLLMFTWLPPSPMMPGQNITYGIRIAEMLGGQSAYDALQSNPAFFRQDNIASSYFQLPISAREMAAGHKYAWQIITYVNGVVMNKSEVRQYNYGYYEALRQQQKFHAGRSGIRLKSLQVQGLRLQGLNNSTTSSPEDIPSLSFSGSMKVEGQTSNRNTPGSDVPLKSSSVFLDPSLNLYGVPIKSGIFLSSQQRPQNQNINSFRIDLDIQKYKEDLKQRIQFQNTQLPDSLKVNPDNLVNADQLKDELDKNNLISTPEKMLLDVEDFGIGTNYPDYSPYTLSGVPVTGLNIAYSPSVFYFAFAGSLNQKPVINSAYRRSLFAGKFGIGSPEESHFLLTGLYVKDDPSSVTHSPTAYLSPAANYVIGIDGGLNLFDNALDIQGEAAGSMLTRDVNSANIESDAIPAFISRVFQPKISSSFDFMYNVKTILNLEQTGTKLNLSLKMIGPGYTSLGVPDLRKDLLQYEAKLDQRLLDNAISISAGMKLMKDNLIAWKPNTTSTSIFNTSLGLRFKGLPSLTLLYAPMIQKNNSIDPSSMVKNNMQMFSGMMFYSFIFDNITAASSITYSYQNMKSLSGMGAYSSDNLLLSQSASIELPLTITASYGIMHLSPVNNYQRINTFDINSAFPIYDVVNATFGFRVAVEQIGNRKVGFYMSASTLLFSTVSIDLSADQSSYAESNDYYNYHDAVVRLTLQAGL